VESFANSFSSFFLFIFAVSDRFLCVSCGWGWVVVGVVPELGWVGFEVVSQLRAGEIINVYTYVCVSVCLHLLGKHYKQH